MTGFVVELPNEFSSPAAARHALGAELVLHGVRLERPGVESAMLIVSELVTNAVLHGSSPVRLTLDIDQTGTGPTLTVAVSDAADDLPAFGRRGPEPAGGWGLDVVQRVSMSWGVLPPRGHQSGKIVWARIDL